MIQITKTEDMGQKWPGGATAVLPARRGLTAKGAGNNKSGKLTKPSGAEPSDEACTSLLLFLPSYSTLLQGWAMGTRSI